MNKAKEKGKVHHIPYSIDRIRRINKPELRHELERYKGKNLQFIGTIIDITQYDYRHRPNRATVYECKHSQVVFASVYCTSLGIEFDHLVIQVRNSFLHEMNIGLYDVCQFSGEVYRYEKGLINPHDKYLDVATESGIQYNVRNIERHAKFNVNPHLYHMHHVHTQEKQTLSKYLHKRLHDLYLYRITSEELDDIYETLQQLPNDGSRERYLHSVRMFHKLKHVRLTEEEQITKSKNRLYAENGQFLSYRKIKLLLDLQYTKTMQETEKRQKETQHCAM